MQSRKQQIEKLRKILKLAEVELFEKETTDDRELFRETLHVFSVIGKEKLYELTSELFKFLDCRNSVLRSNAITTLGLSTRLHVPEFKDVAYRIWLEDKDDIVKGAALSAWASYYHATRNPEVLKTLYKILIDESYSVEHRRNAMEEIFYVSQEPSKFYEPYRSRDFYMLSSHQDFNQGVDWEEMKNIMKKYAPNILS